MPSLSNVVNRVKSLFTPTLKSPVPQQSTPAFGNQSYQKTSNTAAPSLKPINQAPVYTSMQPKVTSDFYMPGGGSQGDVLGASTSSRGGGGAGGGGGSAGFTSGGDYTNQILSGSFDQQAPDMGQVDYDAMIRPALDALDQAVAPAQSEYEANISGIDQARTKGIAGQQSALEEARNAADQARTRNTQQTDEAVNEQRRGLSEIQQGLQARYGGTTGTGAFATELAGSGTMRNIGQLRTGLSNAMVAIDDKMEEVRGATQIAIQDIEDQAQTQKLKSKAQLDQTLNQIRMAKGELQGRKAEMAADAIRSHQQQLAQINASNAQFKQSLAMQLSQTEQTLNAARQRGQSAKQQFSLFNTKGGETLKINKYTGDIQPATPTGEQFSRMGGEVTNQTGEDDDIIRF